MKMFFGAFFGDLGAGIGNPEQIAVAFVAGQRVGGRIGQNERNTLGRQIGRNRERHGGIDDARHHIDLVGQHQFARFGEADVGFTLGVFVNQFDLAACDFAAGFLDRKAHAVELAFAERREDAGRLHQNTDFERVGSICRGAGLDCQRKHNGAGRN
jgi:hypothetical protein